MTTADLTNFIMDTPIGKITISTDKQAVYAVKFNEIADTPPAGYPKVINFAVMYLSAAKTTNFMMKQAIKELAAYFDQGARTFELPLNFEGQGTALEQEVWDMLRTIPYAVTVTVTDIARYLETEDLAAVKKAVDDNPLPIIIPSHRVVETVFGKNPDLGTYSGGQWRKEWLLNHERVSQGKLERDII